MQPARLATLAVAFTTSLLLSISLSSASPAGNPGLPSAPQTASSTPSTTPQKKHSVVHHATHHRRRVRKARRHVASTHRRTTHTSTIRRVAVRHGARHRVRSRRAHHAVRRATSRRRVRSRASIASARYRHVSYTHMRRRHVLYRRAIYHHHFWSPWSVSSYGDPSLGDNAEGQVATIRDAAVKALGRWNGSIVVVDPNTGRILTVVNQKLALTRGYIPCSTVKPLVALAGLDQGVINLNTKLMGMHGRRVNLTQALAHSDNRYFAEVGEMLGFKRVEQYADELGYGQRATLDIPDESAGVFPAEPPPQSMGGVGKLTSFGTGIDQTPLQMAALVSAIANGGTLYWLQYPKTPDEVAGFTPKVRRVLTNLEPYIPEVRQGMAAAVLYGTARRAYNPEEDIFGKTGTCSEEGGRMGWFVSYSEQEHPKYVVVVMLRGGRQMFGPHAAEIAGQLYRALLPNGVQAAADRRAIRMPSITRRAGE
ncbi:MAG: penicillin-binding transpeptidase domain-containing protein [Terriglobia bacterium]